MQYPDLGFSTQLSFTVFQLSHLPYRSPYWFGLVSVLHRLAVWLVGTTTLVLCLVRLSAPVITAAS